MNTKSLPLSLIILLTTINGLAALAAADAPWKPLFNGSDLAGWTQRGGKAQYNAQQGLIVGRIAPNTANAFLCTDETYADFILEYDMFITPGLNSGVQIRSLSDPAYHNGRVHGYQVEADTAKRAWSAGIYDEARRGWLYPLAANPKARNAFKNGQWNHFRVEAIGPHLRTFLNGIPCADLVDDMTPNGFIALQVHNIGKNQTLANLPVKWRNLRIITDQPEKWTLPLDYSIPQVNLMPNTLSPRERDLGYQFLFDGANVGAWRTPAQDRFPVKGWKVQDNQLVGTGQQGGDIISRQTFRNFELKLDFRLTKGANSGVKYLVNPTPKKGELVGPEYQLLDDRNHPDAKRGAAGNRTLGALYDLIPPHAPYGKRVKWNGWNQLFIRVQGDHVEHYLNNILLVKYQRNNQMFNALVARSKYAKYPNFAKHDTGHLLLQDHGDTVYFRSIKIRILP